MDETVNQGLYQTLDATNAKTPLANLGNQKLINGNLNKVVS